MGTLTYLDDHRHRTAGLVCPCGADQFVLRHRGAFDAPATVRLNQAGHITDYTGHPVCAECGTPLAEHYRSNP